MLVLSRKVGEEIVIDGDIYLKILSVDGCRVRIGFDAPEDVRINRIEVEMKLEQREMEEKE